MVLQVTVGTDSYYRDESIRRQRFNVWLIMGALLFVVSDSLLGYNKFVEFIPLFGTLVMLTYGLAKHGLFCGIVKFLLRGRGPKEQ